MPDNRILSHTGQEYQADERVLDFLCARRFETVWRTLAARGSAGMLHESSAASSGSHDSIQEREPEGSDTGSSTGDEDGSEDEGRWYSGMSGSGEVEDSNLESSSEATPEDDSDDDYSEAELRRRRRARAAATSAAGTKPQDGGRDVAMPADREEAQRWQPPRVTKSMFAVVSAEAAAVAAAHHARHHRPEPALKQQALRSKPRPLLTVTRRRRPTAAQLRAQQWQVQQKPGGEEEQQRGAHRRKRPAPAPAAAADDDGAPRQPGLAVRSPQQQQQQQPGSPPAAGAATPSPSPGARLPPAPKIIRFQPTPRDRKCGTCVHCLNPSRHKPCIQVRRRQLAEAGLLPPAAMAQWHAEQEAAARVASAAGAKLGAEASGNSGGTAAGSLAAAAAWKCTRQVVFKPVRPEERCGKLWEQSDTFLACPALLIPCASLPGATFQLQFCLCSIPAPSPTQLAALQASVCVA